MRTRTIVHFGVDECLRIPVLQHAGYGVICCGSLSELAKALEATRGTDAVIFAEESGRSADEAARTARERTQAALILFGHPWSMSREALFDHVVMPGTLPGQWLERIAQEIERAAARAAAATTAIQRRDGVAAAEKRWAEIARDLGSQRQEKPEGSANGLRDFRHAGRIQRRRRGWT